jgi:hypothetical protein
LRDRPTASGRPAEGLLDPGAFYTRSRDKNPEIPTLVGYADYLGSRRTGGYRYT